MAREVTTTKAIFQVPEVASQEKQKTLAAAD
jgi:hypothetical protein